MPAHKSRKPPTTFLLLGVLSAISWALAAWYFATGHGNLDATGHAVGRDFVNLWTAGQLIADGRVIDVFDPAKFGAAQRALLSPSFPFHFWSYPPTFLFAAVPFGWTSYLAGLVLWSLAGAAALVLAARALFQDWRRSLWLLASPAVAVNLVLGQNGALTAALLLAGCALMAKRPAAGGALFGVLTFKPHLGLLAPLAMLAERRWTTIAAAAVVTLAFVGLSAAAFGLKAWRAFIDDALPMQTQMMSGGRGPFQWMMTSAFMAGRLLGLPSPWAMLAQVPFAIAGAVFVWRAWRSPADIRLKFAVLAVAGLMATPQAFNYDMIPLAAAALLLAGREASLHDRLASQALWALPVAIMPLNIIHLPLSPVVLLLVCLHLDRAHVAARG
jgi:alpha-1,2-mannosyltransferase